ncbi:MAG TPA: RtcB family protein, partial [Candidatus Pacearchaeota archaeon]|nr:RtcB family protein [Candidatus Pacearchaeota archaeon]
MPQRNNNRNNRAGRALSRTEARKQINPDSFKKEMTNEGIKGDFSKAFLDEAPDAYKDI